MPLFIRSVFNHLKYFPPFIIMAGKWDENLSYGADRVWGKIHNLGVEFSGSQHIWRSSIGHEPVSGLGK